MSDESDRQRRQIGGELVIPVLGVAFTIYYFTTIWNSPWTAQVAAFLIGGILMLVCGIFIVKSVFLLKSGEGSLGLNNLFSKDDIRTGRIGPVRRCATLCRYPRLVVASGCPPPEFLKFVETALAVRA